MVTVFLKRKLTSKLIAKSNQVDKMNNFDPSQVVSVKFYWVTHITHNTWIQFID